MNLFLSRKLKSLLIMLFLCGYFATAQETNYCEPTWTGWAVNEPTEPITLVQLGQNSINGIDNSFFRYSEI